MCRNLFIAIVVAMMSTTSLVRAALIDIDNAKLQELIDEGVPVIDVRRADEWRQSGVIKGSTLKTFFDKSGRYDAQKWLAELGEQVDLSAPLVLICQSGTRSSIIGKWLGNQFDTVYNVDDGIVKWIAEKHPVVAVED